MSPMLTSGVLSDECVEATPCTHVAGSDSPQNPSAKTLLDPNNNSQLSSVVSQSAVSSNRSTSQTSSVLSDLCSTHPMSQSDTNNINPVSSSVVNDSGPAATFPGPRDLTYARVDLNTIIDPPTTVRTIYLTSDDPNKPVTSLNPHKLKIALDTLCGPVEINPVEYLRNRTLLITVSSQHQIPTLLNAKTPH